MSPGPLGPEPPPGGPRSRGHLRGRRSPRSRRACRGRQEPRGAGSADAGLISPPHPPGRQRPTRQHRRGPVTPRGWVGPRAWSPVLQVGSTEPGVSGAGAACDSASWAPCTPLTGVQPGPGAGAALLRPPPPPGPPRSPTDVRGLGRGGETLLASAPRPPQAGNLWRPPAGTKATLFSKPRRRQVTAQNVTESTPNSLQGAAQDSRPGQGARGPPRRGRALGLPSAAPSRTGPP